MSMTVNTNKLPGYVGFNPELDPVFYYYHLLPSIRKLIPHIQKTEISSRLTTTDTSTSFTAMFPSTVTAMRSMNNEFEHIPEQTNTNSMNITKITGLNNSTAQRLNIIDKLASSLTSHDHQNSYPISYILLSIFVFIILLIFAIVFVIRISRRYKCYNLSSDNTLLAKSTVFFQAVLLYITSVIFRCSNENL